MFSDLDGVGVKFVRGVFSDLDGARVFSDLDGAAVEFVGGSRAPDEREEQDPSRAARLRSGTHLLQESLRWRQRRAQPDGRRIRY